MEKLKIKSNYANKLEVEADYAEDELYIGIIGETVECIFVNREQATQLRDYLTKWIEKNNIKSITNNELYPVLDSDPMCEVVKSDDPYDDIKDCY